MTSTNLVENSPNATKTPTTTNGSNRKSGMSLAKTDFSGNCGNEEKPAEFEFLPPPECPVYRPTEKEFEDPLGYIRKIREEAEGFGICKIIPPPDWQPPFAVDVDKLKFTPRVQRLNELDAGTRVKLNFLDQIAKFWELQGSTLKIPIVDRRSIDLYILHTIVHRQGGFKQVTNDRKWSRIALEMGYAPNKGTIGFMLKGHYERLLYPFDLFKEGKTLNHVSPQSDEPETKEEVKEEKKSGNIEMRRLRFYGAGPKMSLTKSRECKKIAYVKNVDPLAKYICLSCNRGDSEESMLLCDGCDDSFHTFCLIPKLTEIPKGDWRCPRCVAEEVSKPMEAFGFEQAQREYSLQQFGEMADEFKTNYFNMPLHLVSMQMVEKEFWRIVSSLDEDVTVEYGADLHTMDHGSGFPTKASMNLQAGDKEYASSPWNLNNLPILEESVLGYINADISGMKIPWMYVGMCFSTFCWHNEDHWSYSINYLHWGEPKTWYGVPGGRAEDFEETMKAAAPELFQSQPDLLHQLVTIMNPNILMKVGVPVYRTDQQAGEFVVTFPRSYHAGFNQGYNFAEAVNFAPADWLSKGRNCIAHYASLRRYCVFSHDELICKMATDKSHNLSLNLAEAVRQDMVKMFEIEMDLRKAIHLRGVQIAQSETFELLPDDSRQCEECKTTCFLSALTCSCRPGILVCPRHHDKLCSCPPNKQKFLYRYTLTEMPDMLKNLQDKVDYFDLWIDRVRSALQSTGTKSLHLKELKSLLDEFADRKLPKCEVHDELKAAVRHAETCSSLAEKIVMMTANRLRYQNSNKLTIRELMEFNSELKKMPCMCDNMEGVQALVEKTEKFLCESEEHLGTKLSEVAIDKLKSCIGYGEDSIVSFPNLSKLKSKYEQAVWLNSAMTWREKNSLTIDDIRSTVMSGERFPSNPEIENQLNKFRTLVKKGEEWECKVAAVLDDDERATVEIGRINDLLEEANDLHYILPSEDRLCDAEMKASKWLKELNKINNYEHYPYLDEIEELYVKGEKLAVKLDEVAQLYGSISEARKWKQQVTQMFLYDEISLMEAISPRVGEEDDIFNLTSDMNNEEVTQLFKKAEVSELKSMRISRQNNQSKSQDKNSRFCMCSKSWKVPMVQCELCKDRFHENCVKKPKYKMKTKRRFLCPDCHRTKRPRLESVAPLLVAYDKMRVKFPEGQALQYLTERAMAWQEKAKALLEAGTIGDTRRMRLFEDLLMEGDLLEVAVPETLLLWDTLEAYPDRKSTATDFDASPAKRRSSNIVSTISTKRPRRLVNSSLTTVEVDEDEEDEEDESEEEEEEETCAATKCLPPPSNKKKVSWVQCDGECNQWFHLHCIGLKSNELKENEDYFCKSCKSRPSTSKK